MAIVKNNKISLKKISGLPISINGDNLACGGNIISQPATYRLFADTKDFLKNKASKSNLKKVYAMRRDVHFKKDEAVFKNTGLRYDLTIIFPGLLGDEFSKTIGHHHQEIKSKNTFKKSITYPEIYEVVSGKALFLFQEINEIKTKEIYLIEAKAGQKVIVPPGFGHITINPENHPLIISDIFSATAKSVYSFFKKHRGGAYWAVKENSKISLQKNSSYKNISNIKFAYPKEVLNISFKKPLYSQFIANPQKFEFLTNPQKFKKQLHPKNLFEIIK